MNITSAPQTHSKAMTLHCLSDTFSLNTPVLSQRTYCTFPSALRIRTEIISSVISMASSGHSNYKQSRLFSRSLFIPNCTQIRQSLAYSWGIDYRKFLHLRFKARCSKLTKLLLMYCFGGVDPPRMPRFCTS